MLIIDGHNIMNQMSEISHGENNYWHPFIAMMEEYVRKTREKVILVFDFAFPITDTSLDIRCQPQADSLIMELLAQYKGSANTLVSSDRELQRRAHRFRVKTTEARSFVDRLRQVLDQDHQAEPRGKTEGLSSSEVDQWIRVFRGRRR